MKQDSLSINKCNCALNWDNHIQNVHLGRYIEGYTMLQGEHPAIVSTFIKLPFVIKIFVLSIFEWPFYTGFTVLTKQD